MKAIIIFSTVGGNTELVVKRVAGVLEAKKIQVTLKRAEEAEPTEMLEYSLVILASPTYNQGTLEDNFKNFVKSWKEIDTSNHKFATIGLGSTKYYPEYLTEASTILEDLVKEKGGHLICPGLRLASHPLKFLDTLVQRWADKLVLTINKMK